MKKKYRIRALQYGEGWRPKFTRPEGIVIHGIVVTAEAEYPSNESFENEDDANNATFDFLRGEGIHPEDIEIVLNTKQHP